MRRLVALICLAVAAVVARGRLRSGRLERPDGASGAGRRRLRRRRPRMGARRRHVAVGGAGRGLARRPRRRRSCRPTTRAPPATTVANDVLRIWLQRDDGTDLTVEPADGPCGHRPVDGRVTPLPAGPVRWRAVRVGTAMRVEGLSGTTWTALAGSAPTAGPLRFATRAGLVGVRYPGGTAALVPGHRAGDAGFRGVQERRQRAAGGLRQRGRPAGGQPELGARRVAGAGGRGAHVRGLVPRQPSTRQLLGRLRQRKLPGLRRRRRGTALDHGRGAGDGRLDPQLRRGPGRHHVQRLQRRVDGCRRRAPTCPPTPTTGTGGPRTPSTAGRRPCRPPTSSAPFPRSGDCCGCGSARATAAGSGAVGSRRSCWKGWTPGARPPRSPCTGAAIYNLRPWPDVLRRAPLVLVEHPLISRSCREPPAGPAPRTVPADRCGSRTGHR